MAKPKGRAAIEKKNRVLEELSIEYAPIDSIKPNDYNPNRQSEHDFELLVRSMREDGFTQPIIAQSGTRVIFSGEHPNSRLSKSAACCELVRIRGEMELMTCSSLRTGG